MKLNHGVHGGTERDKLLRRVHGKGFHSVLSVVKRFWEMSYKKNNLRLL